MIKPVVRVKVDKRKLDDLLKRLGVRRDSSVTIGVHSDAGQYADGTDVTLVAMANEFGVPSKNIPERSFLRSAIYGNMSKINAWRQEAVAHMLNDGWDAEKALTMLGLRIQQLVQNKIKSGVAPPNAPRTVAAKKRRGVAPRTLIDTTLLLRSIAYRVFVNGDDDE